MKARGLEGLQTHKKWVHQTEDGEPSHQGRGCPSTKPKQPEDEKQFSGIIEGLRKKEKKGATTTLSRPQASCLSAQWSIPLNGVSASEALLETWRHLSEGKGGADLESKGLSYKVSKRESLFEHSEQAFQAGRGAVEARLQRIPLETFPPKRLPSGVSERHSGKGLHQADKGIKNRRSPQEVSTPLMASPLPALHVPVDGIAPSPPLGAAIMKKGIEAGKWPKKPVEEEADLSLLSENIKRILDEEARRHGIDV